MIADFVIRWQWLSCQPNSTTDDCSSQAIFFSVGKYVTANVSYVFNASFSFFTLIFSRFSIEDGNSRIVNEEGKQKTYDGQYVFLLQVYYVIYLNKT